MDPSKTKSVISWPTPKNPKEIQIFLRLANFYRRFINNFSKIVTPLTQLLHKEQVWHWSPQADTAFETIKQAFSSAPILHYFDPTKPIILETDSSDFAIGAIISQPDTEGILHPIAFYSYKLQPAELNYEIYDKEMLAIVKAFKEWRAYLEGAQHQIKVYTDHRNLEFFTTTKSLNRRQARWSELLSSYDFVIIYHPGPKNGKPDALSRCPDYHPKGGGDPLDSFDKPFLKPGQLILSTIFKPNPTNTFLEDIKSAQSLDPTLSPLLIHLKDPDTPCPEPFLKQLSNFSLVNDILYFDNLLYIPDNNFLKLQILQEHHDLVTAGHFGQAKTYELISRNLYWPKMRDFINEYISTCEQCNRCKPVRHKPYGKLQPLPVPSSCWKSISMDYIVSLPPSQGYSAILVIVDRFSKMAHFIPTTNEVDAPTTASLFLNNIYKLHGLPDDIVSDRGSTFTSKFWSSLLKLLYIKSNLSTSFHPQTDGQTERVNQILEQYLRLYCDYQQDDWSSLLPLAEFAYNNSKHSTTKYSPFYTYCGKHPKSLPSMITAEPSVSSSLTASELVMKISEIHNEVMNNIQKSNQSYTKYYNQDKEPQPEYNIGDKVWLLRRFITTKRPSSKLDYTRLGPFEIINKIGTRAFKLKLPDTMKIHPVFHVSLLEPFTANTIPGRSLPLPAPIEVDGIMEYEVEEILDSRIRRKKLEYLVDWKDYDVNERTWEPQKNLTNSADLIKQFHNKYPDKPNNNNNNLKIFVKYAVPERTYQFQGSHNPNSRFLQLPLPTVSMINQKSLNSR